jgi:hypothetical protein
MRNLLTFNLGRRGRALVALALAAAALAILLLGVGSDLPRAWASELPPARPENITHVDAYTMYLPIIFRAPVQVVNYEDHFTNKYSGWVTSGDGCTGTYDTGNSVYRVTMTKTGSCIIWNTKFNASYRQFYGTFKIKVRRTSTNKELRYGLQFDAAPDSTDATGTKWVLEEYPNVDSSCSSKPYFWLMGQKKNGTSHTDVYNSYDDDDINACTTAVDPDKGHWNEMAAVRKGRDIEIFLRRDDDHNSHHSELFDNVPQLTSTEADDLGYVTLRVESLTSDDVVVEFDRVTIDSSTADPWGDD